MNNALFSPLTVGQVTFANRLAVAPMCQYSCTDGVPGDWHLMHLGNLAVSGAGLLIVEATGVEPRARITPGCPGLWNDEQEAAFAPILEFCRKHGNAKLGIQLAHAGRKASSRKPWQGGEQADENEGGWAAVAPSAVPFDAGRPLPQALSLDDIEQIKRDFTDAAKRADQAGFDVVEIHAAHGYLLHQFLSPLSNHRDDTYGGSLENRMRLALEIFDVVREAFPSDKPVGMRISATDWVEGGWDLGDSIALAHALEDRHCDFVHVSSGGLSPDQEIPLGPGYQVDLCAAITDASEIATIAVGMIDDAFQAETIVRSGQADMVALARGMLADPHWTWRAAKSLHGEAAYPRQYERALPGFTTMATPKYPPPK